MNKEGQEGLILNSGRFHNSRGRGQRGGERAEQGEYKRDYRTGLLFTFYVVHSVLCSKVFLGGGGVVQFQIAIEQAVAIALC